MAPMLVIGLVLIGVVCYVHYAIPMFTCGAGHRVIAHGVLILVGGACGVVSVLVPGLAESRWLVFVVAFGTVHVPAAAILFIKHLRGAGQS
jgi:predicted MFS family arabinose efflux permease